MSFKINKLEEMTFDFDKEIEQMEWEIRYSEHRANAAKAYIQDLNRIGGREATKTEVQRARTVYDKEIGRII